MSNKIKVSVKTQNSVSMPQKPPIVPKKTSVAKTTKSAVAKSSTPSEYSFMNGRTIEETYQQKELMQQIFDSPDTYVGSMDPTIEYMWVFSKDEQKMVRKKLKYIEGFYKLFDEVLVNGIDQHQRLEDKIKTNKKLRPVKNIWIDIDRELGRITVKNDGEGIDIAEIKLKDKPIYVPEMLFGELLTSINYDKKEKKTVGGKNGYGAKLANIFSNEFTIETVDGHRKLHYKQIFRNNMKERGEPEVSTYNKVPYTVISYVPDFKRFGIEDWTTIDDWDILERRAYDAAACTAKNVNIFLNGERIKTKTFEDYVSLYIGNKKQTKRVYSSPHPRWEVVVCVSPDEEFEQISFVNGIFTDRGGKHVNHVADNLSKKLATVINNKSKKGSVELTPAIVKKNMWVFVKATIENPNFDTQTKRCLTSLMSNFGSKFEVTSDLLEKSAKLGIDKRARELAEHKAKRQQAKKTDGKKIRKVHNAKLTDASAAGTTQSQKCVLVLTEGDSAATFFKSGIKSLPDKEQKYWGCFPLKGKLLNVRKATHLQLSKNEEIINIKKIMGLVEGEDYSNSISKLRYGCIMILADADKDGDHIKGLVINYIHTYWPSLIKRKGFVSSFATPILKAWKSSLGDSPNPDDVLKFYSEKNYAEWAETHKKGWEHKYYKGLGTHSPEEARDCFKHKTTTKYEDTGSTCDIDGTELNETDYIMSLVFEKKFENKRKQWLDEFQQAPSDELPHNVETETYPDFFNKRMIMFSIADNVRSIPHLCDGLKPSQRKVMYSMFKKKPKKEVRIGQFVGYVLEVGAYHHGEQSLADTIMGLAQDYVGSNNLNLLFPKGQFGTRCKKGKDHAQSRYLHTKVCDYTDKLFEINDREIVNYLEDDGEPCEPEYYITTLPMSLINGAEGIGTGYSTNIPCYKPEDVIANLKRLMNGEPMIEMNPWYRGFNGEIIKLMDNKYISVGLYDRIGLNKIRIKELPIGSKQCKSFEAYKEFLFDLTEDGAKPKGKKNKTAVETASTKSNNSSIAEGIITDIDIIKETDTDFVADITFIDGYLQKELANNENYSFEKKLKIAAVFSTTNMHLYNSEGIIQKYDTPLDIISDFYEVRLGYYGKRKQYILKQLNHKLDLASARYRFISEIMDDIINIYRKKKAQIVSILDGTAESGAASPAYPKHTTKAEDDPESSSYEYLLSMRVDSFSQEKLERLKNETQRLKDQITELEAKTNKILWSEDLNSITDIYNGEFDKWVKRNDVTIYAPKKTITMRKIAKPVNKTKITISRKDDDTSSVFSDISELDITVTKEPEHKDISLLKKKLQPTPTPTPTPTKLSIKSKPQSVIVKKKI